MKTTTAIKAFTIAIAVTATMTISNANANDRYNVASSCNMGSRRTAPQLPVLGIYGHSTRNGMLVTDVVRGTEAWNVGLERGDLIVEIDGRHIRGQRDYDIAMQRTGNHTILRVLDVRSRRIITVDAHLFGQPLLR